MKSSVLAGRYLAVPFFLMAAAVALADDGEQISDDAGLEEGLLALKKGALVTEMNLIYRSGDNTWQFNLKGESLNISSFKTPETAGTQTKEDIEGAVLEKIFLYEKVVRFVEGAFRYFVRLRISENWNKNIITQMKLWINKTS